MMDAGEVRLRTVVAGDLPFLEALYGSTRADELALTEWSDDQKQAFVAQQFAAQAAHYMTHYPDMAADVIEVAGEPAGRLLVNRRKWEIRIVDIGLVPAFRGRGIGGGLLRDLMAEAAASARRLSIHVERNNRARALYERLGFGVVDDGEVYLRMEWEPGADGQAKIA
jgi:ribosomal protein S18 acetylase RimI-like enzyme